VRTVDNTELLSVTSDGITIDIVDTSKHSTELPFNNQDEILYQDFNFDGHKDFGIIEFVSTKGPAYLIYLFKNNQFKLDSAFSEVIQASQGIFSLDDESKTIHIMSRGGCCSRSYETYAVENGDLTPREIIEEQMDMAFFITKTTKWIEGKPHETVTRTVDLNQEGIYPVMSFSLLKNGKQVVLYNINDRTLNYVLIADDDRSEFFYPIETEYKNRDFVVNTSGNELIFENANARYKIYQKVNGSKITDVGIEVTVNGKRHQLKGDVQSLKGRIDKDKILKLDNVYAE
jgi:hypothetical protein